MYERVPLLTSTFLLYLYYVSWCDTMLASAVARFEQVLETSTAAGAPDTQAQQLELLHEIQQQLRLSAQDDIQAVQSKLEGSLTSALLQARLTASDSRQRSGRT